VISSTAGASFFGSVSFEPRSVEGPRAFINFGGSTEAACFANLGGDTEILRTNRDVLNDLGYTNVVNVDRLSAKSLWEWTWRNVSAARDDVVVDATSLPRELLAMILFALSVRRKSLKRVRMFYSAPDRYVTQREDIPLAERWLSRGTRAIRSIVGFPGDFESERARHLVALAGHEDERLLEIISYMEPTRLSISNEQKHSSTVANADRISDLVKAKLRESVGLLEYGDVTFFADSIAQTFDSLSSMLSIRTDENVGLVAMNTKLSFVGAALCALQLRHVRLVYAVPLEYNPQYSEGFKQVTEHDVTEQIKRSTTIPAR
jgi:hypothetical protein